MLIGLDVGLGTYGVGLGLEDASLGLEGWGLGLKIFASTTSLMETQKADIATVVWCGCSTITRVQDRSQYCLVVHMPEQRLSHCQHHEQLQQPLSCGCWWTSVDADWCLQVRHMGRALQLPKLELRMQQKQQPHQLHSSTVHLKSQYCTVYQYGTRWHFSSRFSEFLQCCVRCPSIPTNQPNKQPTNQLFTVHLQSTSSM